MRSLYVLLFFIFISAAIAQQTQQAPITAQVQMVFPPQNATSVPVADSLVIQFTQATPIVASSLSDSTFILICAQSGWGQGVVQFDSATNTITFRPNHPFFADELVTAEATKKILWDSLGVNVPIRGFAWQFYGKVSAKTYGTFSLKNTISTPGGPIVENLTDIDGDGYPDYTVYSSSGDYVYFNNGDGENFSSVQLNNFGDIFSYNFSFGKYQELFVGNNPYMRFYSNTNGRTFTEGDTQSANITKTDVLLFDADLDGTPDLEGPTIAGSVQILYIRDSVIYKNQSFFAGTAPVWSAILDANNDGAQDIIISTSDGYRLLLNDGYGKFGAPIAIPMPSDVGGIPQSGDFDGDGWTDFLDNSLGKLTLFHNNHDSTFTALSTGAGFKVGAGNGYGLTVGDFDGNGTLDAAYTIGLDSLYMICTVNDGTGNFHIIQVWGEPGVINADARLKNADLERNGSLDLLMAYNNGNQVLIFHNDSTVQPIGVQENQQLPDGYMLDAPFPNPASTLTSLGYSLPSSQTVNISLYSVTGQIVATIVNGLVDAGSYSINYDCSQIASGAYIIKLQSAGKTLSHKFTVTH